MEIASSCCMEQWKQPYRRQTRHQPHCRLCRKTLWLLRAAKEKGSSSLLGRVWWIPCQSLQWEVKVTAAESQQEISPLDIIYHHALIRILNQTFASMEWILTKANVKAKQRGSPSLRRSSDTFLLCSDNYWNRRSRRLTVMRRVRKCVFLCVSAMKRLH